MKKLLALILLLPVLCFGDGFFGPYISNALAYTWPQLQTFNGGIAWPGGSLSASAPANSLVQDASGRLGIGTLPSQWLSTIIPIQGVSGALAYNSSVMRLTQNSYVDSVGHDIYIASGTASEYVETGGSHFFYIAPSGSSGGTISFQLTAEITNSGHFLLNTSTDNGTDQLQVNGSTTAVGVKTTAGFTGSTITAEVAAASYTQSVNDDYIPVNFAGTVTITMLSAASYPGKMVTIRTYQAQAVNSAASNISINGVVGTSILPATAGKWATLKSDGTNWEIIDNN